MLKIPEKLPEFQTYTKLYLKQILKILFKIIILTVQAIQANKVLYFFKNVNANHVGFVKSHLAARSVGNSKLKNFNNPYLFPITFIGHDSKTITGYRHTGSSTNLLKKISLQIYIIHTNGYVNLQY